MLLRYHKKILCRLTTIITVTLSNTLSTSLSSIPRPYTHPEPDVIVLCYSATDLTSFNEVETIIWPELRDKFPYVPIILVATKCDAREKDPAIEEFWHMDSGDSPNKSESTQLRTACNRIKQQ